MAEQKTILILVLVALFLLLPSVHAYCTKYSSCHCCDTTAMKFRLKAPNGTYSQWYTMSYDSSPDTSCDASTGTKEKWKYNLGYTFCPVEGSYDMEVQATVKTDTTPYNSTNCGETTTESATISGIYTVNYDNDPNWCACKVGSGHWNLGGEVAANNCCGDDSGEYKITCQGDSAVCNASTDDVACCNASTDCVYNNTCYSNGSAITVNGLTYKCVNGSWTNCAPSWPGDWYLGTSCTVSTSGTVSGNLYIKSGGVLTVTGSSTVLHIAGGYIYVYSGGTIYVQNGATITK